MVANFEETNNQCVNFYNSKLYNYDSLNYRSLAEVAIAKAIDKYNEDQIDISTHLIYLPNNIIVTGQKRELDSTIKIESDFLLSMSVYGLGVLEVDSRQHNDVKVIEKDYYKEEIWKSMGIKVIERFSAIDCIKEPSDVIQRFITRLHLVYGNIESDANNGLSILQWDLYHLLFIHLQKLPEAFHDLIYSIIPLSFDGYIFKIGLSDSKNLGITKHHLKVNLEEASYSCYKLPIAFDICNVPSGVCYLMKDTISRMEDDFLASDLFRYK